MSKEQKRSFKMNVFMDLLSHHDSYTENDRARYERIFHLLDYFFRETDMDEDLLEKYTLEEFEWFYYLICYWPTWEMDCEREDLNHFGVQKQEIIDVIEQIASLPQIRQTKVTFL